MQSSFEVVLRTIITYLVLFSPILITLYLLNRESSRNHRRLRTISYSLITLLFSALFLLGIFFQFYRSALTQIRDFPLPMDKLSVLGPAIWIPSLIALVILLPQCRRRLSGIIPIKTERTLHTIALSLSMIVFIWFFIDVILSDSHASFAPSAGEIITSIWAQNIFLLITALIGIGWISRLDFKASLVRLGLTPVRARHVLTGIVIGISLGILVIILESIASHIGLLDPAVTKATEELIGPLVTSVFGILTLGLAAAIGEEAIFRGALLPRLGLVYSSLLFALVHTHYGMGFPLFIVFGLGLFLGMIRRKYNTVVSIIVHATYNMTMGTLAYFASKFF